MQDAGGAGVVADPAFAPQLAELLLAVEGQRERRLGIVEGPPGQAFQEKAKTPKPFAKVRARAEEQGSVLASDPAQDLQRRRGVGPGLGVADRDLSAVREARFEPRFRLPVDYRNLVARPCKVPGTGRADDAGSENDDPHCPSPTESGEPPTLYDLAATI